MLHLIKVMKRIALSFLAIIGTAALAAPAFAWTNPAANPATGGGAVTAEQNAPANSIRIKSDGKVGIGVSNPASNKLVVGGGIDVGFVDTSNLLRVNYGTTNGGSIQSYISGAAAKMSLNPDGGNVGIGTASPGQKLSVAGIIQSTSGGIMFPDGTTQTTAFSGGSQTISAANISAGEFGANTGGGNYSFPLASQVGFGNFTIRRISTTSIGFYDSTGALAVEFDEGT